MSEMPEVDFRNEWNASCIHSWLIAEPIDILNDLDADCAWERPPTVDGILQGSSREQRCQLFDKGEAWRNGELVRHTTLMLYDSVGACMGFSECCLVQQFETKAKFCRVCWGGEDEGEMLAGCACRGSLRHIHAECMRLQYSAQGKMDCTRCDLCHQSFHGKAAERMAEVKKENLSKASGDAQIQLTRISTATSLWQAGRYAEAADLFQQAIEGIKALNDPNYNAQLYSGHHNLGLVHLALCKYDEAFENVHRAKKSFIDLLGDQHQLSLKARHNEALIKQDQGKYKEAIALYDPLLKDRRRVLGEQHLDTLKTGLNLGMAYYQTGNSKEAVALLRATSRDLERVSGRTHSISLACMMNLALALSKLEPGSEESIQLAKESAEGRLLLHGAESQETFDGWRDLGLVLKAAGQYAPAEESMRRALNGQQKVVGFEHQKTRTIMTFLCEILDAAGRADASEELRKEYDAHIIQPAKEAPAPRERGPIVAFILNIYIHPDYRRRGIGSALVQHWKSLARKASAESLQILVSPTSESILFFSSACGMKKVSERPVKSQSAAYAHFHCTL